VSGFSLRDGDRLIRFGPGVAAEAPELIEAEGLGGYALLTTERALRDAPTPLSRTAAVVLHVPGGPVPDIAAAVREGVAGRPMVAYGGGRVVDAAKAIAGADGLRCAAVPTTLAGSSFTPFHRMPAGVDDVRLVRPSLAVCDPALMSSAPMPGLAATAMNALAHAVESLYAPGANPVAEGAALRAAGLFRRGLTANPPGAEDLALGAVLAGWAVGTTGLAVHHAICPTIVRETATPHAQTNAVMLPHTVAFMAGRASEPIAALAQALGAGTDAAEASEAVAALSALAGPRTLAELGFDRARVPAIASSMAEHPAIGGTPGGVSERELRDLVERAL
jgi:maleylacetate reductase